MFPIKLDMKTGIFVHQSFIKSFALLNLMAKVLQFYASSMIGMIYCCQLGVSLMFCEDKMAKSPWKIFGAIHPLFISMWNNYGDVSINLSKWCHKHYTVTSRHTRSKSNGNPPITDIESWSLHLISFLFLYWQKQKSAYNRLTIN